MRVYLSFDSLSPEKIYVDGHAISYYGSFIENAVFISPCLSPSDTVSQSIYISAMEAILNGYAISYIPIGKGARIIEKAAQDAEGRLFGIYPFGLKSVYRHKIKMHILSSGGALSLEEDDAEFSRDALYRARIFASTISDATLVIDPMLSSKRECQYIQSALDIGRDVAIIKDCLDSKYLRAFAKEGCPVVSSFADFLSLPRAIVYKSENSRYGKELGSFDIMYLDGRM